jgi:hypothetical protein
MPAKKTVEYICGYSTHVEQEMMMSVGVEGVCDSVWAPVSRLHHKMRGIRCSHDESRVMSTIQVYTTRHGDEVHDSCHGTLNHDDTHGVWMIRGETMVASQRGSSVSEM